MGGRRRNGFCQKMTTYQNCCWNTPVFVVIAQPTDKKTWASGKPGPGPKPKKKSEISVAV